MVTLTVMKEIIKIKMKFLKIIKIVHFLIEWFESVFCASFVV